MGYGLPGTIQGLNYNISCLKEGRARRQHSGWGQSKRGLSNEKFLHNWGWIACLSGLPDLLLLHLVFLG